MHETKNNHIMRIPQYSSYNFWLGCRKLCVFQKRWFTLQAILCMNNNHIRRFYNLSNIIFYRRTLKINPIDLNLYLRMYSILDERFSKVSFCCDPGHNIVTTLAKTILILCTA